MKTIRMPRRNADVKSKLPKAQYDKPVFKRTNSQPSLGMESVTEITSRQINSDKIANEKDRSANLKKFSSLNLGNKQAVDVESKSLIQKAHDLYNVRGRHQSEKKLPSAQSVDSTPEKIQISLADRAARLNNQDLPKIDELADKENDTFAVGGPLQALKNARNISVKQLEQKNRERSQLRSAEVSKKQYKLYREPGDRDSVGVANLARAQLPPRSRLSNAKGSHIHETNTPAVISGKALDLDNNQMKLPRIQSSR